MTKIALEHKRLSPNESLSKVKDTTNNDKIFYRHRFATKYRSSLSQDYKDYKLSEFKNFESFIKYIKEQAKDKYQIL